VAPICQIHPYFYELIERIYPLSKETWIRSTVFPRHLRRMAKTDKSVILEDMQSYYKEFCVMYVNFCLIEDMSRSLVEMSDILEFPLKEDNEEQSLMVRDARIYSFLRCAEIFKAVLFNIYLLNDLEEFEAEDADPEDIEDLLETFFDAGVFDQERLDHFSCLFGMAGLLAVDKEWLEDGEKTQIYEDGVKAIPDMYEYICSYLQSMSDKLEIIDSASEGEESVH
jgi:hypothetical protein